MVTWIKTHQWIGLAIALAMSVNTFAWSALPSSVNPAEVQKFEHSYETWVQNLTQTVVPSTPVTVLIELQYSNSKERLEEYEDALEANHLPGLPDVIDPHYSHPSESPLFALVTKKRVKLIFEGSINETQKKILNEILTNKLKIKNGDALSIQQVQTGFLSSVFESRRRQGAAIVFLVLMIAGLGAVQRKRTVKNPALAVAKINSKLSLFTQKTVDPIQFIMKADTKVLLAVIRNEKPLAISQVIQGTNETVASTLLRLCSKEQRQEIRNILVDRSKKFTLDQIKYQQLLLAAKIHRESQKIIKISAELDKFVNAQSLRAEEEVQASSIQEALMKVASEANIVEETVVEETAAEGSAESATASDAQAPQETQEIYENQNQTA